MKNDVILESKPIANPAVVVREMAGDWTVLYNPDTADAVGINPVGIVVWRLLDGRRSLGAIVDGVKRKFAAAPETAGDDVIALVNDLAGRGFVGYELGEIGSGWEQRLESMGKAGSEESIRTEMQPLKDAARLVTFETVPSILTDNSNGEPLFFAHRGSSMNPTLHASDLLQIVPYVAKPVRVGDVIAVAPPGKDHLVVHRVVRVTAEGVRTRGDNNAGEDDWCLPHGQVIGRVAAAWRGRRRRRIFGGAAGRLWAWLGRGCCTLARIVSAGLHPAYHLLARWGVVRRLLPRALRPCVVVFKAGEGYWLRLLLGQRVVGWYIPAWHQWHICRPFRLIVDEQALPLGREEE